MQEQEDRIINMSAYEVWKLSPEFNCLPCADGCENCIDDKPMYSYPKLGIKNDTSYTTMYHHVLSPDCRSFYIQISGCKGKFYNKSMYKKLNTIKQ